MVPINCSTIQIDCGPFRSGLAHHNQCVRTLKTKTLKNLNDSILSDMNCMNEKDVRCLTTHFSRSIYSSQNQNLFLISLLVLSPLHSNLSYTEPEIYILPLPLIKSLCHATDSQYAFLKLNLSVIKIGFMLVSYKKKENDSNTGIQYVSR